MINHFRQRCKPAIPRSVVRDDEVVASESDTYYPIVVCFIVWREAVPRVGAEPHARQTLKASLLKAKPAGRIARSIRMQPAAIEHNDAVIIVPMIAPPSFGYAAAERQQFQFAAASISAVHRLGNEISKTPVVSAEIRVAEVMQRMRGLFKFAQLAET